MMALWCFIVVASVGLASLWACCAREPSRRTRELTQLALTARLDDVVKDDSVHKVVEINLGYGHEFWTLPEGQMEIDRKTRIIVNGKRIASGLSRGRTRKALIGSGKIVEQRAVRF